MMAAVLGVAARILRALILLAGVVAFGLGVLVATVPGTEGVVPVDAAVDLLGNDYLVVAAVSVVALAVAVLIALTRLLAGAEEATPPLVERVQSAPRPGSAFDASIDRSGRSLFGSVSADEAATRGRLREAATLTVVRAAGCTRSTAERHVAEETWTDDPVAAGFLADDAGGPAGGPGRRGAAKRDRAIRRTVEAIEQVDAGRGSAGTGGGGGDAG